MRSTTSRTLEWLRAHGYAAQCVERRDHIPGANWGKLHDLWGFDIVAVHRDQPATLYVQTTSGANVSHRLDKLREIPEVSVLLAAGNRALVVGWRKIKPRGETREHWAPRVIELKREEKI